jgi:hypothetical protein
VCVGVGGQLRFRKEAIHSLVTLTYFCGIFFMFHCSFREFLRSDIFNKIHKFSHFHYSFCKFIIYFKLRTFDNFSVILHFFKSRNLIQNQFLKFRNIFNSLQIYNLTLWKCSNRIVCNKLSIYSKKYTCNNKTWWKILRISHY